MSFDPLVSSRSWLDNNAWGWTVQNLDDSLARPESRRKDSLNSLAY